MSKKNWVRIIQGDTQTDLTERFPIRVLGVRSTMPAASIPRITHTGSDGAVTYTPSYEPFNLEVDCLLEAYDNYDYHLLIAELKSLLCGQSTYYVQHEKLPARRYCVDECRIEEPDRFRKDAARFTLNFYVFKGFSESLATSTVPFEYNEEAWGVGLNLPEGEDLQYTFENEPIFNIYNPSDMRINPRFHPLSIALTCDSVPGQYVRIYNRTNGTLFELKKPVAKSDVLLIDGVYPYLNDARCGIDTNHGLITLERGWNRVQVINATNTKISFDFPFYYRG
ncbi:phage tail domain-containing protein [Listeria sp. ILCC792]|uniref:phage tail domain-containing protein n=1 Tax=Listeria sp. ILCC792 TaxID=1918331 RepID=UPI000B58DF11|nr:phage tail domain-containing protein [Listeria sp. ILCC792]